MRSWVELVQSSRPRRARGAKPGEGRHPSGAPGGVGPEFAALVRGARRVDKIVPSPSVRLVHSSRLELDRPGSVDTNRPPARPAEPVGHGCPGRMFAFGISRRSGRQVSYRMSAPASARGACSGSCFRRPAPGPATWPTSVSGSADADQPRADGPRRPSRAGRRGTREPANR